MENKQPRKAPKNAFGRMNAKKTFGRPQRVHKKKSYNHPSISHIPWSTRVGAITLLGMLILLLAGCITPEVSVGDPDLVPMPAGPFEGQDAYCYFSNGGYLRIAIENQGQGDAPPTSTRVLFSPGGTIEIPTPPVRAGEQAFLEPIASLSTLPNRHCA